MKAIIKKRWKALTNLGVTDELSSGEAKRVRLVNRIGFVVACFMLPFIFQYMEMGLALATGVSVFSMCAMLFSVWLNAHRRYIIARYVLLIGGGLTNIFVISCVMGFENGDHTALTMAVLLTFMLFDLKQWRHLVTGLLATLAVWITLEASSYTLLGVFDIPFELQRTNYTVTFTLTLFCVTLIAYYFQGLSNRQVDDIVFRAQQELRAVFNNSYDAIFLANPEDLTIQECNERSLQIFGVASNDFFIERDANTLFEVPMEQSDVEEIKHRVQLGHKWSFERALTGRDEEDFWGSIAFTSVRYGERNSLLIRISDITEKKLAEVQMRLAKDKAEAANTAKDNFLANMSHELRTPLNGILGMTQLIQMSSTDATLQEYAKLLEESGSRLLNVFNTMLDLSKLETTESLDDIEAMDVNGMLRIASASFVAEAEAKGLSFDLSLPDGEVISLVQKDFFEKSMMQVLSNALKFTEAGHIQLALESDDDSESVRVVVSDTGIGMSQEFVNKNLFTKFEQESEGYTRNYEGAGLGLALTKRMTELMDADIEVKSEKEKGTEVTFIFRKPEA